MGKQKSTVSCLIQRFFHYGAMPPERCTNPLNLLWAKNVAGQVKHLCFVISQWRAEIGFVRKKSSVFQGNQLLPWSTCTIYNTEWLDSHQSHGVIRHSQTVYLPSWNPFRPIILVYHGIDSRAANPEKDAYLVKKNPSVIRILIDQNLDHMEAF